MVIPTFTSQQPPLGTICSDASSFQTYPIRVKQDTERWFSATQSSA